MNNSFSLLLADWWDSLAVTDQNELKKEQKDSILKANEADLHQKLTRADEEMVEIKHSLQQLTSGGGNENEESEQSRKELLRELKRQQAVNTVFREMCEEALSRTVFERTGQKIKGIKATQDSSALAGFINTSGEELKINQDISDVIADDRSFAAAGVIKNLDFKDLRRGGE